MAINIHVVGDERWVLAKQMRDYLRILERASKLGKLDARAASEVETYETVLKARLKGLPSTKGTVREEVERG